MTDEMPPRGDLKGEFENLAQNLKEALHTAWESDERKSLQNEIEEGLSQVGSALNEAFEEFQSSDVGQQLKQDIDDIGERVRSGELEDKVRTDLTAALQKLNVELEKVIRPNSDKAE
jgi:hypothetical protein